MTDHGKQTARGAVIRVAKNGAWRCECGNWNPPSKSVCETCWKPKKPHA